MPRWSVLGCVAAALACSACDRVFGVEGTPSSVDGARPDVPSVPDGARGAYSDTVVADHPVAYYLLDETSGPTAVDIAGRVDGTYAGDVLYAQSPAVLSEPGASPQFGLNNPGNSGVLFGDDFAFEGLAPFALELWIFPILDPAQPFGNVISKWQKPMDVTLISTGYLIYTDGTDGMTTLVFARDDGTGSRGRSASTFNPDGWSHVVGSYDGTKLSLYINGELKDREDSPQLIPRMTTSFVIGSGDGTTTTNPFRGQIDDVAIYDHALSATQVHAHYEAAGVAD